MRFFVGFILVALGLALVLKTEWLIANFGTSAWAEEKFGSSGGTRIVYKFLGLGLIFFGLLAITNLHQSFLRATVGKIFIR